MSQQPSLKGHAFFYRIVRGILFIAYKACFRFKYFGADRVPREEDGRGVILAPNHVSYLDPPVLGISLPRRVTYLAKDYLFKHGFVGWILRYTGAYPIKSNSGNDFRSIRDLIRILRQGACIVVFPEGTRSADGKLKDPEGGIGFLAVKSEAWVVPVYIHGSYEAFPKGAKGFRCRPIQVYYGKPFIPAQNRDWISGDEKAYMDVGRKIMTDIRKIKEEVEQKSFGVNR